MNDFKRNDRFGGKRFGNKPAFQRAGGFTRPQGQMYPAVCAQCGNSCEVPFRPDGQRPVYCRDCLGGNKPPMPTREHQKSASRTPVSPQVVATDPRIDAITGQLAKILVKLDQILLGMAVSKAQGTVSVPAVKSKRPLKSTKK